MKTKTHIVLAALSALIVLTATVPTAFSGSGETVWLDIENGETAFMVDKRAGKAWWAVDECRRPIPMKKGKNKDKTMISEIVSEQVRIGSHPVELRQQFRFNVTTEPVSVEVYNSVRGGWSSVPVTFNAMCAAEPTCRTRMEWPEC